MDHRAHSLGWAFNSQMFADTIKTARHDMMVSRVEVAFAALVMDTDMAVAETGLAHTLPVSVVLSIASFYRLDLLRYFREDLFD